MRRRDLWRRGWRHITWRRGCARWSGGPRAGSLRWRRGRGYWRGGQVIPVTVSRRLPTLFGGHGRDSGAVLAIPRGIGRGGCGGNCALRGGGSKGGIRRGRLLRRGGRIAVIAAAGIGNHHGQPQDHDSKGNGMLVLGKDHGNSGPC
jgi:hypothetical protein